MRSFDPTEHPDVVLDDGPGVRSAVIRGTRVHVRAVVGYWEWGRSIEEIPEALPA
jgi:uncharacterized protein (DUF433 family)